MHDVGKPKAHVAAERINARVAGVHVVAHHCRIEEKPADFYKQVRASGLLESSAGAFGLLCRCCRVCGVWWCVYHLRSICA